MKLRISEMMGLIAEDTISFPERDDAGAARRIFARVKEQIGPPKKKRPSIKKILAIVAAATLIIGNTACAVDYIVNQRQVYFFGTIEELTDAVLDARSPEEKDCAIGVGVPCDDSAPLQTISEYVQMRMTDEESDSGDKVLSDETGTDGTVWDRKKVITYKDEDWGAMTRTYYTGADLSELIQVQDLLPWDLSWVSESFAAVPDGQIVELRQKRYSGRVMQVSMTGGFETAGGGTFTLSADYGKTFRYSDQYVLSSGYDYTETCLSADGYSFIVMGYQSRIWADLYGDYGAVHLFALDCSREEIEDILAHLKVAGLMEVYVAKE